MFGTSSVLYKSLILLSLTASAAALASTKVDTRIHDLITPEAVGEPVQLLSTADGRVYYIDSSRTGLIGTLIRANANRAPVTLTLDAQENVVSAVELPAEAAANYSDAFTAVETHDAVARPTADENTVTDEDFETIEEDETVTNDNDNAWIPDNKGLGYRATNLSSMSQAQSMFGSLDGLNFKGSECYQRAHMWTKYMSDYHNVNSMKTFLFFTARFKNPRKYRWWFHVAPMVYVKGQEVMMDAEFGFETPTKIQDWTDHFMMDPNHVRAPIPNHPVCAEVKKYSDYYNNQYAADCYTLKLPMYYYQPADAENLEQQGSRINFWRDWDVKHSRKCFKRFWKC